MSLFKTLLKLLLPNMLDVFFLTVLHFHPCHSWVTVQWSFPFSVHWAHLKSKQFLAVSSSVCDFHSVYSSFQNLSCHFSSLKLSEPFFISPSLFCSHPWLLVPVHECNWEVPHSLLFCHHVILGMFVAKGFLKSGVVLASGTLHLGCPSEFCFVVL